MKAIIGMTIYQRDTLPFYLPAKQKEDLSQGEKNSYPFNTDFLWVTMISCAHLGAGRYSYLSGNEFLAYRVSSNSSLMSHAR